MTIEEIREHKRSYMDLLLLADEQESMIDAYLDRGELFALFDSGLRAACVVTKEGDRVYEIKNIATLPPYQGQGYGKRLIEFLLRLYGERADTMLVGTGDSPLTIPFYQSCGFAESHRVPNFFLEHYDHPIFENGAQLVDMVYLKKELRSNP